MSVYAYILQGEGYEVSDEIQNNSHLESLLCFSASSSMPDLGILFMRSGAKCGISIFCYRWNKVPVFKIKYFGVM